MTVRFNPITDPWIDVSDPDGQPAVLSAAEALIFSKTRSIDAGDGLSAYAIARFLRTIAVAAGLSPATDREYRKNTAEAPSYKAAADWAVANKDHFEVFGTDRPLYQDASLIPLGFPENAERISYWDMTASWGRPLLSDHRHGYTDAALTPQQAWVLLLTQQTWAIPGNMSAPSAVYGPGAFQGKTALHCGTTVFHVGGTIAEQLAWTMLPDTTVSEATWTYTPREDPDRKGFFPEGLLEALTWQNRRMLIIPSEDGLVRYGMLGQGVYRRPQLHSPVPPAKKLTPEQVIPIWTQKAADDIATTEDGSRVYGTVVTTDDDYLVPLERWHAAPEGSLPHAMRGTGNPMPPVGVVAMGIDKKKVLHVRTPRIPALLLEDPRAGAAAKSLSDFHRSYKFAVKKGAEKGTQIEVLSIAQIPDSFGYDLMDDEEFLSATEEEQYAILHRKVEAVIGRPGDPYINLSRRTVLPPPKNAGTENDSHLFTSATADPAPVLDDLYPEQVLTVIKRLYAWQYSGNFSGEMADLRRYAHSPRLDNLSINRLLNYTAADSGEQTRAAIAVTAALFAAYYNRPNVRRFGNAPLPRLMRAFGSSSGRGPQHTATRATVQRAVQTKNVDKLLPVLLNPVRYASSNDMCPNWHMLLEDLINWGPQVRDQWTSLFHTTQPVTTIRKSVK